uniref:Uncharacterized protein n=1 Tax=Parascaris univalens TaxID=6257 RepID=A0A915AXN8_PARUN
MISQKKSTNYFIGQNSTIKYNLNDLNFFKLIKAFISKYLSVFPF